jgi:hypothetical protein
MKRTPQSASFFVGLVAICALVFLCVGLMRWESVDLVRFACFMVLSMAASQMRVSLPGLNGNMSVNLPFMLLAAMELSMSQALLVALASVLVQCMPRNGKRMPAVQMIFNVSVIVNAIGAAYLVAQRATLLGTIPAKSLGLACGAAAFFVMDTVPVAVILRLAENEPLFKTWRDIVLLTFPYFVLSAGVCSIAATAVIFVGWQIPLAMFPVMGLTYASYRRYFGKSMPHVAGTEPFTSSAAAD